MTESMGLKTTEWDADGNESVTYTWKDVGVPEEEFYEKWNAIMNLEKNDPIEPAYSQG